MDILWEFLETLFFGWRIRGPEDRDGRTLQRAIGHRRSIVRMIGSLLPFPQGERVHLNLAVWKSDDEYEGPRSDKEAPYSNAESIDEGLDSASTLALFQNNGDMKKLLDEVMELKLKMIEILELQKAKGSCCDSARHSSGTNTAKRDNSSSALKSPPPPPPMPPPPQLLTQLHTKKQDPPGYAPIVPAYYPTSSSEDTPPRPVSRRNPSPRRGMFSLDLNELRQKKARLKPLPRTPGGRPVKHKSSDTDSPGDSLTDILRKRMQDTQFSDSDCSFSSDVVVDF